MSLKSKIEPILAYSALGILTTYLLCIYDKWQPNTEFPNSWRAQLYEVVLAYVHRPGFGIILGKGTLLFILLICVRTIYKTIKS